MNSSTVLYNERVPMITTISNNSTDCTHVQGRRSWGGWGGLSRPTFLDGAAKVGRPRNVVIYNATIVCIDK